MFIFWFTLVVIWISCGVAACGYIFAYQQRRWSSIRKDWFKRDQRFSTVWIPFGLIILLIVFVAGDTERGWLWPWSVKAKQEAFFNITFED